MYVFVLNVNVVMYMWIWKKILWSGLDKILVVDFCLGEFVCGKLLEI